MTKFYFTESQSFVEYSPEYIHVNIMFAAKKLETKVMHLHKIRVEKISLFHIKKSAANDFWLLPVMVQV